MLQEHDHKKSARLEARTTPAISELVQRAAALTGSSLSEFVVNAARLAAEDAIRRHEVLELSARDQARLVDALLNPPPVAPALLDALQITTIRWNPANGSSFRIECLDKQQHDRQSFDCGVDVLNHYLQRQATQDMRRQVAICYVAVDTATDQLAGYYTVAAASMALNDLPEATAKKLPRYPVIPAVRIGRLAVARRFQGRKLGGLLLADAIKDRCIPVWASMPSWSMPRINGRRISMGSLGLCHCRISR